MCTFKSIEFNYSISEDEAQKVIDAISMLEIGSELDVRTLLGPNDSFSLCGEIEESNGQYLEGQKIFTSNLISVRAAAVDTYVATTDKGKEYMFSFARRYGVPTLNAWHFANEDDAIYVDYIICQHRSFELKVPVGIRGQTADVPRYANGTNFFVEDVVRFAPSEYEAAVVAITKRGDKYLLPLDQRVGFITANIAEKWHLTFEYPPTDEQDVQAVRDFIRKFRDFSSVENKLPPDEYDRQYLHVPPEYGIGLETNRYYMDKISYFMRISFLSKVCYYAVLDEYKGKLMKYDLYHMDKDMKYLFDSLDGGKKTDGSIIKKASKRMLASDIRI